MDNKTIKFWRMYASEHYGPDATYDFKGTEQDFGMVLYAFKNNGAYYDIDYRELSANEISKNDCADLTDFETLDFYLTLADDNIDF